MKRWSGRPVWYIQTSSWEEQERPFFKKKKVGKAIGNSTSIGGELLGW
jgi:hypothetical protein